MIERFADTAIYAALFNRKDRDHALAVQLARDFPGRTVTTDFVILELSAVMAEPPGRAEFVRFFDGLPARQRTEVIPLGLDLYRYGIDFYRHRADKGWSLTNCISFGVMSQRDIDEALTGDHHFAEAGFRPLFPIAKR